MNKKRKYAFAATTGACLAIAVIIIVNVIVAVVSDRISLSVDLTKDSILGFDETTVEVVKGLDMDVSIISLIPEADNNGEMVQLDEILKKYDTLSEHITYTRADVSQNPALLTTYTVNGEPLTDAYNIIFETERMSTVVNVNDLFIMYKDNETENILSGALKAEHHFTSAIIKVTEGSDINAYVTTGHGEGLSAEKFKNDILPGAGYNFNDYAIMSDPVPENADLIIVASPKTDYSAEEIEKLSAYLSGGGSLQVLTDVATPDLPMLFGFLNEWGITVGSGIVGDEDSSHYSKYKTYIIAEVPENEYTDKIAGSNTQVMFPVARPIKAENKNDVTTFNVASTSKDGYVKANIYSVNDSFEPGDEKIASDVAVIATRPAYDGDTPMVFVSGTSAFLQIESNRTFCEGLMSLMTDQPHSIYISPKNIVKDKVVIRQSSVYVYCFIVVILIPVLILAWGFVTWIRRRHL